MGGQNASIVLADADLPSAATTIARAAMEYAGQKCTATRRAIVVREVADAFVGQLVDAVQALQLGDPGDEATAVGPVISEQARGSIDEAITAAESRGARRLTRGAPPTDGWYVAPAVLAIDDPTDAFVMEETFGPAVAILTVDSEDEAIGLANSTRFGLSGSVFSRDLHRARGLAARLDVGLQRVNAPTTGVDFHVPFGGEKASGYGPREQGRAARDFFTHTRTMLIHPSR
jgi:aldehyde dehydrogenase (NAD+)